MTERDHVVELVRKVNDLPDMSRAIAVAASLMATKLEKLEAELSYVRQHQELRLTLLCCHLHLNGGHRHPTLKLP
jgi:hypothetical protein